MTSDEDRILVTAPVAARMLSIGVSTLWEKVKKNELPQPVHIGTATRWRVEDLRAVGRPTSQPTRA